MTDDPMAQARKLADRRLFVLDAEQWEAFQRALARPAEDKPGLRTLLHRTDTTAE